MRWLHIGIVVLFGLATLIFALQNLQIVTITFLGLSLRLPMALLAVLVYVLGMITGGSLWSLLRKSFEGSRLVGP